MQGQQEPVTKEQVDSVIEGRSWWKVCLTGCAILLVAAFVAGFFLIRSFVGSTPKRISVLPDGFPQNLVLYRPEEAREILFYPGEARGKVFRFMTAPVKFIAGLVGKGDELPDFADKNPIETSDTVSVLWTDMDATQDEVLRFYAGSLQQIGVEHPEMQKFNDGETVEMVGSTDTIVFSLVMVNDPKTPEVDTLTVIAEYPSPQGELGN
jgi:hypothetical protein